MVWCRAEMLNAVVLQEVQELFTGELRSVVTHEFSGRLTSGDPIGRVALSKRQVFHFNWCFFLFRFEGDDKRNVLTSFAGCSNTM